MLRALHLFSFGRVGCPLAIMQNIHKHILAANEEQNKRMRMCKRNEQIDMMN